MFFRPDSRCLGRVGDTTQYKGVNAYGKAREIPGVKIYRYDSPLYFANAERFQQELYLYVQYYSSQSDSKYSICYLLWFRSSGIDPIVMIQKLNKKAKN